MYAKVVLIKGVVLMRNQIKKIPFNPIKNHVVQMTQRCVHILEVNLSTKKQNKKRKENLQAQF